MVHAMRASSATTAAEQQLLLAGRITLVRTRWSRARGEVGAALRAAGVAVRAVVARLGGQRGDHWRGT
jgi:hypothetical protein